ncbi:MAG: hypothetical protein ACO3FR_08570 [Ilumatobacteraceae bacterium]
MLWSDLRRLLVLVVLTIVAVPGVAMGLAVVNSDEPALQTAATWARDHGFSGVVDRLEMWRYDGEASKELSDELSLTESLVTTSVAPLPEEQPIDVPISTTTTFAPLPLEPVQDEPLEGEGQWLPIAAVEGRNVLWVTSTRPLKEYGSVRATFVQIDQTLLRFGLYNGDGTPGGRDWINGRRIGDAERSRLVAAFNGGFRFEHIEGGYFTEGREVRPLVVGEATLAIDTEGKIVIGEYGRDLTNDGTWVSLRQNLPLMVDERVNVVDRHSVRTWGADKGGSVVVFRSALCSLESGMLMYAAAGDVNISDFADILMSAGCSTAMQLDVNGTWPQFAVYLGFGTPDRTGVLVDTRMSNRDRYLNGTDKDFIAAFAE